jgi:two-component system nitrate/nitrite response regulator NarL
VSEDVEELAKALGEGACGYLLKSIEADMLSSAIRRAAAGESVVAEDMTAKLVAQLRSPARGANRLAGVNTHAPRQTPDTARADWSALTPRERDIVRSVSRGAANKDIARELDVAESTVKIHVRNVLRKLKLSSRVQIAIYALEQDPGGSR